MDYIERLEKINEDSDKRSVWNSIDLPIRPLIFELNRIGMITKFSCCGFTYPEEKNEEPKTHGKNGGYVLFYVPNNDMVITNFKQIVEYNKYTNGFKMNVWGRPNAAEINLVFTWDGYDNFYCKKDNCKESIHSYELQILKQQSLTNFIRNNIKTVNNLVEVVDGNSRYGDSNWQVKPKQTYKITCQEYYAENPEVKIYNNTPSQVLNSDELQKLL